MSKPDHDPSVLNEPHLSNASGTPDPSETRAERALRRDRRDPSGAYDSAQGVWDEPDILPGRRSDEVIEQDWSCTECGYNLRGLKVGHPCPECGSRALYRPPPTGAPSYQAWLRERLGRRLPGDGWLTVLLVVLAGGPLAVVGAMLGVPESGLVGVSVVLMMVVFGPAVEEVMKIAGAALVVEIRPYLFRRTSQIFAATLGTAMVFAAIENVVYLNLYFPNPSGAQVAWRWTVCVALHVGCTAMATRGVTAEWQRTVAEGRPPQISRGLPALVKAIVIHGGYNLAVIFHPYLGF